MSSLAVVGIIRALPALRLRAGERARHWHGTIDDLKVIELSLCAPTHRAPACLQPIHTFICFRVAVNGIVNTRPAGHRKHEWTTASARQMVWSVTDTFMRRNGALPPTHKPATGVPMWKQPYAETIAAVLEEERAKRAADIAASAAAAPDEAGLEEGKQGGSAAGEDGHGKGGGEGSAVSIRSSPATGGP